MSIGRTIRDARIKKGYTQEQLGSLMGVQKSAVAKWENDRVVNIKRQKLQQLAELLDIPAFELVSPESVGRSTEQSPIIKEITGMLSGMDEAQLSQVRSIIAVIKGLSPGEIAKASAFVQFMKSQL